jgi:hypothetical protein
MDNAELEKQINVLRRQLERMAQALDETRRRVGLSHLYDEQLLSINSRANDRAL